MGSGSVGSGGKYGCRGCCNKARAAGERERSVGDRRNGELGEGISGDSDGDGSSSAAEDANEASWAAERDVRAGGAEAAAGESSGEWEAAGGDDSDAGAGDAAAAAACLWATRFRTPPVCWSWCAYRCAPANMSGGGGGDWAASRCIASSRSVTVLFWRAAISDGVVSRSSTDVPLASRPSPRTPSASAAPAPLPPPALPDGGGAGGGATRLVATRCCTFQTPQAIITDKMRSIHQR